LLDKSPAAVSKPAVALLFVSVFAVHTAYAVLIGNNGWDDGSITVAFARTFADDGRIALTPVSEVVEGYSSPFWFLLLAATYFVAPLGFDGMILASQLWTGFFCAVGAVVLYLILRPLAGRAALPISLAVFITGIFLNETANGMEMSALCAVALGIVYLLRNYTAALPGLIALAAATPWVRFEAAGYVIAGAVLLVVVSRDYRRAGALFLGVVASLAVLTALRLAIFDSIVANTIIAKRSEPYTMGESLVDRVSASKTVVKELLYVLAPAAVIAVLAIAGTRLPKFRGKAAVDTLTSRSVDPATGFALGYLAGAAAFNLAIGANWGYTGRMEMSMVAIAIVVVAFCAPIAIGSLQAPWRIGALVLALIALSAYGLERTPLEERFGASEQGAITPASYRETGEAIDSIRTSLGLDTIAAVTPDVGGSSLCCPNIEILDLGLLANKELARDGYEGIGAYLEEHRPDVIETHSVWSDASHMYDIEFFRETYSPVAVDDMWFYLRNDHLAAVQNRCHAIAPDTAEEFRYRGDSVDEEYIASLDLQTVCQLG